MLVVGAQDPRALRRGDLERESGRDQQGAAQAAGGGGAWSEARLRENLTSLFTEVDPSNLRKVEGLVTKHAGTGREGRLWQRLAKKYGADITEKYNRAPTSTLGVGSD